MKKTLRSEKKKKKKKKKRKRRKRKKAQWKPKQTKERGRGTFNFNEGDHSPWVESAITGPEHLAPEPNGRFLSESGWSGFLLQRDGVDVLERNDGEASIIKRENEEGGHFVACSGCGGCGGCNGRCLEVVFFSSFPTVFSFLLYPSPSYQVIFVFPCRRWRLTRSLSHSVELFSFIFFKRLRSGYSDGRLSNGRSPTKANLWPVEAHW